MDFLDKFPINDAVLMHADVLIHGQFRLVMLNRVRSNVPASVTPVEPAVAIVAPDHN